MELLCEIPAIWGLIHGAREVRAGPCSKKRHSLVAVFFRNSGKTDRKIDRDLRDYSMWMASDGQTSTQVSQSTHMSLSTLAFSLSMDIADAGHSLTQVSQPVHFVVSTTATKTIHSIVIMQPKTKNRFRFG